MITLMYHNLVRNSEPNLPEVSYQVSVAAFAWQLERVASRVLDPEDVSRALREGGAPRPGLLLTFDDGAAGLSQAVEILRSRRARAVIFVCPGQLERGIWFYRLAQDLGSSLRAELSWQGRHWRLDGNRLAAYADLVRELEALSLPRRESALAELREALALSNPASAVMPPHPALQTADAAALHALAQTGCFLFANHSWSHPDLTRLSAPEVQDEIERARGWLEQSGLPTVPWFAFPRGSYNDTVVEQVKARGLVPFAADSATTRPDVLPRIGIYHPDGARWRFELKLFLARTGLMRALHRPALRGARESSP
jgi:peptidoglycan/xylan/chitin deacetylase (PgdA/CDA1 family)